MTIVPHHHLGIGDSRSIARVERVARAKAHLLSCFGDLCGYIVTNDILRRQLLRVYQGRPSRLDLEPFDRYERQGKSGLTLLLTNAMTEQEARRKFDQLTAILKDRGRVSRITGPERGAVLFGQNGNIAFLSVVRRGPDDYGVDYTLDRIPEALKPGEVTPEQPGPIDASQTPIDSLVHVIERHLDPSAFLFADLQLLAGARLLELGVQLSRLEGGTLYLRFDPSLATSDAVDFNQLNQQIITVIRGSLSNDQLAGLVRSISVAI